MHASAGASAMGVTGGVARIACEFTGVELCRLTETSPASDAEALWFEMCPSFLCSVKHNILQSCVSKL